MSEERTFLIDASVFLTLAKTESVELLRPLEGDVEVPQSVVQEITSEPATSELQEAIGEWIDTHGSSSDEWDEHLQSAATHLGRERDAEDWDGDVALLATALCYESAIVVTDDKPLRQTCKALSIPVSGSIGVLIRAVERGDLEAEDAKARLEAMDEVGARLSASLYRRAERLIDEAAEE